MLTDEIMKCAETLPAIAKIAIHDFMDMYPDYVFVNAKDAYRYIKGMSELLSANIYLVKTYDYESAREEMHRYFADVTPDEELYQNIQNLFMEVFNKEY